MNLSLTFPLFEPDFHRFNFIQMKFKKCFSNFLTKRSKPESIKIQVKFVQWDNHWDFQYLKSKIN